MHGCRAGMDCTSSGSGSMGSSSGYGSTGFDTSILEDNPGKQVLVAGLWGPPVAMDPQDLIPPF